MSGQLDLLDEIAADLELDSVDAAALQLDSLDAAGLAADPTDILDVNSPKTSTRKATKPTQARVDPEKVVAKYINGGATPKLEDEESAVTKPGVVDGVVSEKTSKIITDNRERCRRHRQKKREAEANLYKENIFLKQERADLATRLSELELEVQSLRGRAVVDLSKENELLKAQIKKHKQYIEKVVKVALTTPLEVDDVENERLVCSAIESGVGQVVGLAYSSLHSDAWKKASPLQLHFSTFNAPPVTPIFQYLPVGSTAETAVRLVVRWDMNNIPFSYERVKRGHNAHMAALSNVESLGAFWSQMPVFSTYNDAKVLPMPSETSGVFCFAAQMQDGDKKKQIAMAIGHKDVTMFPSAFSASKTDDPFQAQDARVSISTAVDAISTLDQSVETVYSMSIEGAIIREGKEDTTNLTFIQSWPVKHAFIDLMLHGAPLLDDQLQMNPQYVQFLNFLIEDLLLRIQKEQD